MEVKGQRRMAARVMKCGESRVWFDPSRLGDISQAITTADIRRLISSGVITERPKKSPSLARARHIAEQKRKGRRKGHGSRKGSIGTRLAAKHSWINRVRSQRRLLKEMLGAGLVDKPKYKMLYKMSKGGFFRSRAHLKAYVEEATGKAAKLASTAAGKSPKPAK